MDRGGAPIVRLEPRQPRAILSAQRLGARERCPADL